MNRDLNKFKKKKYDVLIIGGGINGAAIANLAAACGASVALLEKNDFASGTSSKSTKLLHGGIRYLENLEFDLVHEALRERFIQYQSVPHLVRPQSFIIPVYRRDSRPLWMMKFGVWLYDMLSGRYRIGHHRFLTALQTINLAPGINRQGLIGGVEYYDAQMDDTRIVLENVLMAASRGAHVANYVAVKDFIKINGQSVGVRAKDMLGGDSLDVMADTIISTVGPWTDELKARDVPQAAPILRPTKGVHIVYRGQISPHAFVIQTQKGGRIFFIIPFKGNSLIGTTDTDFPQPPDQVKVDEKDVAYLLSEASRIFGQITFEKSKVITTFAGVRPLVAKEGEPSKISRKHVILKTLSGVHYLAGGKYTTYRAMAEETIKKALPKFAGKLPYSRRYTLYGSGAINEEIKAISQRLNLNQDFIRYLISLYGSKYMDVVNIMFETTSYKERICNCCPAVVAQVIYARRVEMARTPEDVYERRLGLSYVECNIKMCRKKIEEIFKEGIV